ncbi:MAG: PGPGW domain-containing protein [Terriglobales bacterium]
MRPYLKRALVLVTGWAFIALGIVGLFLPILQGILFLLIGLVILSTEYVWAHHLLNKLRQRFPKLGRVADEATAKANRWMQRLFRNRSRN